MTLQLNDFKVRQRPVTPGRYLPSDPQERFTTMIKEANALIAEPFKGVAADGKVAPGLFPVGKTGVSTDPVRAAAEAFAASLSPEQKAETLFSLDSDAWRRWSNIHPFVMRHGALIEDMDSAQRDLALGVLEASLSPAGFKSARDIMRLNESIREITGKDEDYGEWLYWLSIFGTPSPDEPWGWQIDGHHLIINSLVLADQLVTTPTFMGSEPVAVDSGKYAGTRVFETEENAGMALARTLTGEQRRKAIIGEDLPREVFTTAFRDNFELKYEGIRYDELANDQQGLLLDIVTAYVGRTRTGHDGVKMDEVRRHLSETYFAWMGGTGDDDVFYYRVHSPVILIEFDHLPGIALDSDVPTRNHIHTVVRTPNGNDYGKDLLRQHHEQSNHSHG